jgi:hypothetical protein
MIIHRRFGQENPETLFMIVRNSTADVWSQGYPVCGALLNVSSANGYDAEKPAASNLGMWWGVVEDTSISTQKFGVIQVWGYNSNAYVRFEGANGVVPEGTVLGPLQEQYYCNRWNQYGLGPMILMSRHAAADFEGQTRVFVRGL